MPLNAWVRIAERVACLLAIPALACGIYYSARLAVADAYYRQNTPASLAQAVRADAGNASYHQLYAEHLESLGHDPTREREMAALLSPLESRYWIDLGAQAEVGGDYGAAERYYLKAASVDRKFAPRWALMNYYLRRHDEEHFWQWAPQAMAMAYDDSSELFRLCWIMTDDAESIRRRIPQTDYLRSQYLSFLLSDGHLEAAAPVARELAERATAADVDLLLTYCGLAMTANTEASIAVWNTLLRRKWEPFETLNAPAGVIVTNGSFATAPIERGFDWHFSRAEGVLVTIGAGVSVELTGQQAEVVTLLNQWIPVEKDASYRIDYQYSSAADGPLASSQASGLAWEIENPLTGALLARGPDLKTGAGGETDRLDFTASGITAAMLSLRYERERGTVRREEKFTIRKVTSRLKP